MADTDDDVPWGRPTVSWIPLPPFTSSEEHTTFVRTLATYLTMLDPDGPRAPTRALVGALLGQLQRETTLDGRTWGSWEPQLTPLEFQLSVTTFFPAPWTPEAFAAALQHHQPHPFNPVPSRDGAGWSWENDPFFEATPRAGGGWEVVRNERGVRRGFTLDSDGDLVLLWMAHRTGTVTPPYHGERGGAVRDALAPAVASALLADAVHRAYPLHRMWREDLDESMRPHAPS